MGCAIHRAARKPQRCGRFSSPLRNSETISRFPLGERYRVGQGTAVWEPTQSVTKKEELFLKREDYITWDEYFMGIAMLAAKRSKDPNTQVGACIVSPENIIISTGYNGMPKGCSDDEFPWSREGAQTKYPYVVHAELNAILNANGRDLRGSRLYVALFPCNECAKAIIQSGVQEVLYLSDKYNDTLNNLASKRMLQAAGVKFTQLKFCRRQIVLDFVAEEAR